MRLALALALVLIAVGCGGQPTSSREREEVLLGVIANLNDRNNEAIVRGADLALAQYNSNPDRTYDVRIRRFNTKGEAGAADAATRAVATERLIGVVGPLTDKEALAAAPILQEAGVPAMFPSVSSAAARLLEWTGFRRLVANRDQLASLLATEVGRRVKGPIHIFHAADGESSSAGAAARAAADDQKIQVTRQESIADKADLKALAASIAQGPPPGLLLFGDPGQSRTLIDLVRRAGYKGLVAAERLRELPQPPNDALTATGNADPQAPALASMSEAYADKYAAALPAFAAESFEAAAMLLEAIEEVDPEPEAVSEFLRLNRGFLGDTKRYEFDDSGEMVVPPGWVYIAKGGWRLSGVIDPGRRVPAEGS